MHGRLDYRDLPGAYERWPRFGLSSISLSQRQPLPKANWIGNVYHGLPLDKYLPPASAEPDGEPYLVFLGRLSRDKRPDRAVEIARRAGLKLKIAAKIDAEDKPFYQEVVEPLTDGDRVEYVGEIGDGDKADFVGKARALLFPIDWPEPFGLVVIEAMAVGTPVVVWRQGAMPEIVDQGETGFVVDSIEEAVEAVAAVERLDRRAVRAHFERRFASTRMARDYETIYAAQVAAAAEPAAGQAYDRALA